MDTEYFKNSKYFHSFKSWYAISSSQAHFLSLGGRIVKGGLALVSANALSRGCCHRIDELLYGRVGGEEAAHVGVHVVVGAKGQGHLNTLGGGCSQLAVSIEAVDSVTGVSFIALASVQLGVLAEQFARKTFGLTAAGGGDVTAVADHAVAVVLVTTCIAMVS